MVLKSLHSWDRFAWFFSPGTCLIWAPFSPSVSDISVISLFCRVSRDRARSEIFAPQVFVKSYQLPKFRGRKRSSIKFLVYVRFFSRVCTHVSSQCSLSYSVLLTFLLSPSVFFLSLLIIWFVRGLIVLSRMRWIISFVVIGFLGFRLTSDPWNKSLPYTSNQGHSVIAASIYVEQNRWLIHAQGISTVLYKQVF